MLYVSDILHKPKFLDRVLRNLWIYLFTSNQIYLNDLDTKNVKMDEFYKINVKSRRAENDVVSINQPEYSFFYTRYI